MKKLLLLVLLLTSTAAWGSDKERWYTTADNERIAYTRGFISSQQTTQAGDEQRSR